MLPKEKFCMEMDLNHLNIRGQVNVCGCTSDYCNDDPVNEAPPADDKTESPPNNAEFTCKSLCMQGPVS